MAINIHPTAIVHPDARLGDGIEIGPYTVVEEDVEIGQGCEIGPYVRVAEGTRLGRGCRVFQGAALGSVPQDLKYQGEKTTLHIGDFTTIREGCTLNRGTVATGKTVIGNHCYLMAYCHVAHDCRIGDHFVAANNCNLAGHVTIGDHVMTGGVAAIAQFCRVGEHSFLGAYSHICKDVVPFAIVAPDPMRVAGINRVGLERAGFSPQRRRSIRDAFRLLFRSGLTCNQAIERLESDFPEAEDIRVLIDFAKAPGQSLLRMTPRRLGRT